MRKIGLAMFALALTVLPAFGQTYGLGVGSASGDSVVVKIDGNDKTFNLGTGTHTSGAEAFLKCLVTDRIIKVERSRKTTRLFMLDNSNVADLLREFVDSNTSTDPCTVGKSAYVPRPPALAAPEQTAAVAAPAEAAPPAQQTAPKKKLGRKAAAADRPVDTGVARDNERVLGTSMPLSAPAGTSGRAAVAAPASNAQPANSMPSAPTYRGLAPGPAPTQPTTAAPPPPPKP